MPPAGDDSPLARFRRSMTMDQDKWRDGVGYDLAALAEASPEERLAILGLLLGRSEPAWYDVEALAAFHSPPAQRRLREWAHGPDREVRIAVARFGSEVIGDEERIRILVEAIEQAEFYGGLTQALLEIETFHPPPLIDAMLRGVLRREGAIAMHLAAMLMYVHGQATEAFDWELRPFYLQFTTEAPTERAAAFRDLCLRLGIDPAVWLASDSLR